MEAETRPRDHAEKRSRGLTRAARCSLPFALPSRCEPSCFHVRYSDAIQGRSSVVEQRPFKPKVVGSIPTAPTNSLLNVYAVL